MELVVLLHSSLSSSRQWRLLVDDYSGRFRFLPIDLIGYGITPLPNSLETFGLDDELGSVESTLAGISEPFHLVGHSYGGAVALQFALRHPDRVRSVYAHEPVLFSLLRPEESAEISEVRHGTIGAFFDYWSGEGAWLKLSEPRRREHESKATKVELDFQALFTDHVKLDRYRTLQMPVTITVGELSPKPARRVAELLGNVLKNGTVRILPGVGHMAPITHPQLVNKVIISALSKIGEIPYSKP